MNVAADMSTNLLTSWPTAAPRPALLVTVEGLWGAGKTTISNRLGKQLSQAGYQVHVMHYGPRHGVIGKLSQILENEPLRSRDGAGGYARPHHATVDAFLRLCREAYHHNHLYRRGMQGRDILIVDHGVYSKLAYALCVLAEQHRDQSRDVLFARIQACVRPWFLHPDRAVFLDVPWPLARERAIARGTGGGNPASVERLLFLPRMDAAYRHVIAAQPDNTRIVDAARLGIEDIVAHLVLDLTTLMADRAPGGRR